MEMILDSGVINDVVVSVALSTFENYSLTIIILLGVLIGAVLSIKFF